MGLQVNKFPTPSYVTIGGTSEQLMYNVDGAKPVYAYQSTETRRWKVKIHELMIKNEDNTTYSMIDDSGANVHYTEASIDSFYRSILVPTAIFPTFMTLLNKSFNKTGPSAGAIFCNDKPGNGNCWVQGKTCDEVKSGFRDIVLEFSDLRGYPITPDSYLLDSTGASPDGSSTINYCNILFQRNNVLDHTNEYVLGTIFMFNYYLVFDFENQQIGFNGRSYDFSESRPDAPSGGFPFLIVILIAAGVVLLAVIACVCVKMRNKKLEDQLTKQGYENLN